MLCPAFFTYAEDVGLRGKVHMKKKLSLLLVSAALVGGALTACGGKDSGGTTHAMEVIEEASKMDKDELYQKAMEEINGKEFIIVANSSRTPSAATAFVEYCKTKYNNPNFNFTVKSTQPKNNQIFAQIKGDVTGSNHNINMTLIQDGAQIKSKMIDTGYLLNYIPKEWDGDKARDGEPLALQSLNKVFAYNTNHADGEAAVSYNNVWDFALKTKTQFMQPSSEPVGQNFLYMLTQEKYAGYVKDAYDALDSDSKAKVDATLTDANAGIDALMKEGNFCANAKYSLAWIYNFIKSYTKVADDGPIQQNLTAKSSGGMAGLLVYSKFRSTKETAETSNTWIDIAAYNNGYKGFGGYMYKHYLQVLRTAPFPWTSCALINFMVTEHDGFQPWGKDMGGYSSSPAVAKTFDHSHDGDATDDTPATPIKNDRGYDWWMSADGGRLVLEDSVYCASVAPVLSEWIAYL